MTGAGSAPHILNAAWKAQMWLFDTKRGSDNSRFSPGTFRIRQKPVYCFLVAVLVVVVFPNAPGLPQKTNVPNLVAVRMSIAPSLFISAAKMSEPAPE